jgi:hypothetical protein
MFYLHHMSLCQELPTKGGRVILDPAFWNESEGGKGVENFTSSLKSASGNKLVNSTEFVVTDAKAIDSLSKIFRYLFFIFCEDEYINEMPVNYFDEWDKTLKIDNLVTLGWSVYAFSEPAFLYGSYPVKFEGDNITLDRDYFNQWGLIKNEELARKVVKLNNSNEDANSTHWRVLGICVDQKTFARICNI